MKLKIIAIAVIIIYPVIQLCSQDNKGAGSQGTGWKRTREILDCVPRLVDRQDLVEDNFNHRYITNNPRDIEVGYFSVEPITYVEQGNRFCEVSLPAAGVSSSYFRGTFTTSYTLPGKGVYQINIQSNALIYNNEIRIINPQRTIATVVASHRLQVITDAAENPNTDMDNSSSTLGVYSWEVEIDEKGRWKGNSCEGECNMQDEEIPGGHSSINLDRKIKGPGVLVIEESVIFHVEALSAYKYEPIFQAISFFNFEPLSISAKLLPCE
jgi:hypothetical protein